MYSLKHLKWSGLFLIFFLTGCSATEFTIDRDSIWGRYAVGPLSDSLDWFAKLLFDEYGLALLVITVIVRLIVLPLTLKQYRSSKQMQALQPELKKIREKYSTDTKKQQEETMKLFQKNGVNPLSGCFPLLVQMPVLFALYYAILGNPEIREHDFLWVQLGTADATLILPILAAVTTFLQQFMMQSQMPSNMKFLLILFPVLIFVTSINFPSALVLYWVYSNLFTIVQTYFIYKPGLKEVK